MVFGRKSICNTEIRLTASGPSESYNALCVTTSADIRGRELSGQTTVSRVALKWICEVIHNDKRTTNPFSQHYEPGARHN